MKSVLLNARTTFDQLRRGEFIRFVANGLVATAVHYSVLYAGVVIFGLESVALASVMGAAVGICSSFLGNYFFVFQNHSRPLLGRVIPFVTLYTFMLFMHGTFMLIWSDWLGLDFRPGFLIATALQTGFSYLANRYLVFAK